MGMGGVQRITKFCKYLPEFGWQPTVITVKNTVYYGFDETLLDEIPLTKIYRTESLDPLRVAFKLGAKKEIKPSKSSQKSILNFMSELFLPDNKILWAPFAIQKAVELFKREEFDAILTTSPPHSIHFIGLYLKRKFGIPWVADFRDPWADSYLEQENSSFKNSILRRMEKKILKNSDLVVSFNHKCSEDFLQKSLNLKNKLITITNGFDKSDFNFLMPKEVQPKFTLTYLGSISKYANPKRILLALKKLSEKVGKEKIIVKFIGTFTNNEIWNEIQAFSEFVEIQRIGYLSHSEALLEASKSDVLFLFTEENGTGVVPSSKIYEYLAFRKQVLAVLPDSDTKKILDEIDNARVCEPKDEEGILQAVSEFYQNWENGDLNLNESEISQFERRILTKKLAETLGTFTNKKSPIQ